jgi:hypothetical protein
VGEPARTSGYEVRTELAYQGTATARIKPNASSVAELARFFLDASPVRMPMEVVRTHQAEAQPHAPSAPDFTESIVIEFGTPREVLFACHTPLEFADQLRLRSSDGTFDVEASVVAVQYHPGQTIVAARFLHAVPNWIVKS